MTLIVRVVDAITNIKAQLNALFSEKDTNRFESIEGNEEEKKQRIRAELITSLGFVDARKDNRLLQSFFWLSVE